MTKLFFVPDTTGREVELAEEALPNGSFAVVADVTTWEVIGERIFRALDASSRHVDKIILPRRVTANKEIADEIIRDTAEVDMLIAVGSGTINDLCKYASHAQGKPYMVFATAPSMNGYVSTTASLTVGKHKTSLKAHAPAALVADMKVLTGAPRRLIHAGLGDMLCRATVQADWLLSHLLLGTSYDAILFDEILPLEAEMIGQSERLREKDAGVVELLMQMLILSGESMARCGSSAPASQGEHMIAHTMEMLYGEQMHDQYHGEQISVTSVAMAQLQDKLLLKKPIIKTNARRPERFVQVFGKELGATLYEDYQHKLVSEEMAEALNDRIGTEWSAIHDAIRGVMHPPYRLENALRKAHCPLSPTDLRWSKDRYEHVMTNAYLSRGRFTFLDIAAMDMGLRYWFG